YEDYVIGDSVISRVYYVEGLGHNLFSVGKFCDSDLEVAFRIHSCYVRDVDGVELLKGSHGLNLYTIFVEEMMKSSSTCLLSKASKNKSWLWHRRLNHLNFGIINDLARKDLILVVLLLVMDVHVRTAKLRNDIQMFQQHHGESLSEAWTCFKDLIRKVPHYGNDIWLQLQIFYNHIDHTLKHTIDYAAGGWLKEFENRVMNFIVDQEEKVKQLEEYMDVIRSDFMKLSLEVVGKLKEEIWMEKNRVKKIEKITSTPQVLPSFKEYTPPVTYPEEVQETLGTLIEVEPLDETQLEDLSLNTCNHNTPFSSREVPSLDGPEPQPLLNSPSLDVSLGDVIGPEPPIKPHSLDSSKMKVVDYLTTQTPPSPHVGNSHPKGVYSYYNPGIDNPKRHYRFKPGLLGKSVSLGVDISNWEMFDNDWGLESKEVSPLGEELNLFDRPSEVERGRILEANRLEPIL
ncbi:ribonuclease H-like domain-containing protein, partial [Tanacetum coccineum]